MKIAKEEIKKIAVFRALQLGDMLCAIPALRALHHAYPEAEITLLGLPWARCLLEQFPEYIHAFKHFPGYPGLPEQNFNPINFTEFLKLVQIEKYDLVLQMQGNGSIVNPMIELFGARYHAGFCMPDHYCKDENFFVRYPTGIHEIERHLALMTHLDIPLKGTEIEFPLSAKDQQEFDSLALPISPKEYVCVHAGSRDKLRQWSPRYFAELANYCQEQGFTIVLTGTDEEMEIVQELVSYLDENPVIACGKTNLGTMAVLIKNAALMICNCTGVSHLAAASKTPSLVISMDGEPERWAPLDHEMHCTIDWRATPSLDVVKEALDKMLFRLQRNHIVNDTIGIP